MWLINKSKTLKEHIRHGKYAWPGGYPIYFLTDDGTALSYDAVKENYREVLSAVKNNDNNGWKVIAADVNWEDGFLYCSHTGDKIESAYGEE